MCLCVICQNNIHEHQAYTFQLKKKKKPALKKKKTVELRGLSVGLRPLIPVLLKKSVRCFTHRDLIFPFLVQDS